MDGQITIFEWLESQKPKSSFVGCSGCYCNTCLYWWSSRCRYGACWDDHRAEVNPYNKTFPDRPPRRGWSNYNKPGEQEHWCRGGIFYPERKCKYYVEYEGQTIENCVRANVSVFQDGYMICTLKDAIGCDVCIAQAEGRYNSAYNCEYMSDTGCERMFTAKSLILDAIQAGEEIEPCAEQCCIGCHRTCGYRCGQDAVKSRRK